MKGERGGGRQKQAVRRLRRSRRLRRNRSEGAQRAEDGPCRGAWAGLCYRGPDEAKGGRSQSDATCPTPDKRGVCQGRVGQVPSSARVLAVAQEHENLGRREPGWNHAAQPLRRYADHELHHFVQIQRHQCGRKIRNLYHPELFTNPLRLA